MTQPLTHTIIAGETLDIEFRLPGEVLENVFAFVEADAGLDTDLFVVTIEMPDTIRVRSMLTNLFKIGTHAMRLWVEYPDNHKDVLIDALVVVKGSIDHPTEANLIIDGGSPHTTYEDEYDGGEA